MLSIGLNSWPGYEFLYLADELEIYQELGLQVRIVEFDSLGDVRRAFERGQIDVMGCTLVELLQARTGSPRDPTAVFVTDYSNGGDVILARDTFHTVPDLAGRRIGVELGSLNVYVLARALENHGLAFSDVELVPLTQLQMPRAIAAGDVEAVVTYPPFLLEMEHAGGVQRIFSSREIPGEVLDVIAIDQSLLADRTEEIECLLRGVTRAIAAYRDRPAECIEIMARREGITVDEFARTLEQDIQLVGPTEQLEFLDPGGKVDHAIRAVDRVLRSVEQIRGPSRVDRCSDSRALKSALERELAR